MPTSAIGLVRLIMISPSWQDRARAPLSRDAKFFGISDTYEWSGLAKPTNFRNQQDSKSTKYLGPVLTTVDLLGNQQQIICSESATFITSYQINKKI
jgi:hypothetical protein